MRAFFSDLHPEDPVLLQEVELTKWVSCLKLAHVQALAACHLPLVLPQSLALEVASAHAKLRFCVSARCSSLQGSHLPPWPLITASVVLPSPDCHIVEITEYVTFLDWLFLPSNMHSRFLCVFSRLDGPFLFSARSCSLVWMDQFVYLFTCWRTSWLFPVFGSYK